MAAFGGSVVAGILGENNWTYLSGNPYIVGKVSDGLFGTADAWTILVPESKTYSDYTYAQKRQMYENYVLSGRTSSVTMWKSAIYKRDDGGGHYTLILYANVHGSILSGASIPGYRTITFVKNGDDFIQGTPNYVSGEYYRGLPIFEQYAEMETWLGNNKTSVESSDNIVAGGEYDGLIKSGSNVAKAYKVDDANMTTLSQLIGLGVFGGNIGSAVINSKVIRTPGAITVEPTAQIVSKTIGGTTYTVSGNPILKQGQLFDFGEISFEEKFHSFIDYSQTSIKIFLPYSGTYPLDASIVMGGTIHLYGVIDMVTGSIVYYIEVHNPGLTSGAQTSTVYSYTGNCSMDMPISTEDYGRKISQLLTGAFNVGSNALTGVLVGGASGGPIGAGIGAITGLASSAFDMAKATQYVTSGSLQSVNGFSLVQYPYVIITTPQPQYPENYGHHVGYPCEKELLLGSLSGYTKVEKIHLGISDALDSEIEEIESLLKNGIVI